VAFTTEGEAMRVFIAGIMQGSRTDRYIDDQGYRITITNLVRARFPAAEIVDPWALHPNSVDYGPQEGKRTLLALIAEAARCDLLIAYLPLASMGTALEIWEAHKAGKKIVAISPLQGNWVVKFLSDVVVDDLDAFREFVERGGIEGLVTPGQPSPRR
jgi:hypothetical protein